MIRSYDGIALDPNSRRLKCPTVSVSISQKNVTCSGFSNGSATVTPSGGLSFSYSWTPTGGNNSIATGLSAGSYSCLVTNECGNSTVAELIIFQPAPFSVLAGDSSTICNGSDASLSSIGIGGTETYIFNWMPSNLTVESPNTLVTVTPTVTTTYTLLAIDSKGCTDTKTQIVNVINCPKLISDECNSTLTVLDPSVKLHSYSVTDATDYEWEFTDIATSNIVFTKKRGAEWSDFYLTGYWPTILYNKTYSVRIRANVASVWGPYGIPCTITTPTAALVPTKVKADFCGITLSTLNSSTIIRAENVFGANDYEWEFTDLSTNSIVLTKQRGAQWTNFYLTGYFPSIEYNKTYSVKVRAAVGGVWGPFGAPCTISTPTAGLVPTQVRADFCGITLPTLNNSTIIRCDAVTGATDYEYEFTDIASNKVYTKKRGAKWPDFYVKTISEIAFNTTYSVRVRAYVGGVWGTFDIGCLIRTPVLNARFSKEEVTVNELEKNIKIEAYPNPTTETLNISFEALPENTSLEIYNNLGELILIESLNDINNSIYTAQLNNGLYHVKIFKGNKLIYIQKIIK